MLVLLVRRLNLECNDIRTFFLGAAWTKKYKPIEIFEKKDLGYMTYEQTQKYKNKIVRTYINIVTITFVGAISTANSLIKSFGYYWDKESLYTTMIILVLMIIMIFQIILHFLK